MLQHCIQATLRLQEPGVGNFDATLQSDLITALAEGMTTVGKAAMRIVLVSGAYSFRRRRVLLAVSHGASPKRALLQLPLATDVTPAGHSGPLPGVKDVTIDITPARAAACRLWRADLRQIIADKTVAVRINRHSPWQCSCMKQHSTVSIAACLHCCIADNLLQ